MNRDRSPYSPRYSPEAMEHLIAGIGRVPVMRDTVYRPVGNERRVQSFGAAELAPVVQTPPKKVVAAE